jgi:hypothetical protein
MSHAASDPNQLPPEVTDGVFLPPGMGDPNELRNVV